MSELKARLHPQKIVEVSLAQDSDKWQQFRNIKNVKSVEQPSPDKVKVNLEADADPDEVIDALVHSVVKLGIRIRGIGLVMVGVEELWAGKLHAARQTLTQARALGQADRRSVR